MTKFFIGIVFLFFGTLYSPALPCWGQDAEVKAFILAGQSNMQGHGLIEAIESRNGGKGSLEWLATKSPDAKKYSFLRDKNQWAKRDDVKIWYLDRQGDLAPGFGASAEMIGPELGFGNVVGDAFDEPVLLIKLAWGGKSVAVDFRPPSAGGEVGPFYRELVTKSKMVLADYAKIFPKLSGKKIKLCGIGWHQGWNDRVNQGFNDAYEENLSHLIRDIRKELNSPELPFVIGETGMSGHQEKHPRALSLMKAQAAVAKRKEFAGTVAFVGTRDFYRPREMSPSGQAYHWNNNAETYYLIGQGMGKAMLKLLQPATPAK